MDQLSNYELIDLIATCVTDSGEQFMNFLTVFTAHLVAVYLVAEKLSKMALVFISTLFVASVLIIATAQHSFVTIAIDLVNELSARNLAHAAQLTNMAKMFAGTTGDTIKVANVVLQLGGCVGGLVFAFYHGRNNKPPTLE